MQLDMASKKTKGKEKNKLKTILADPYKKKYPVLNDNELNELQDILINAINANGGNSNETDRKAFAGKNIRLGLESSLRAINNRQCACVFISLSLNPKYLIGLIGRNVELLDEVVPVFVQPKLEEFTKKLFSIGAFIMVLPLQLVNLSCELDQWVKIRQKPKKCIGIDTSLPSVKLVKKKRNITQERHKSSEPNEAVKINAITPTAIPEKTFKGDFIPFFSSTDNVVELDTLNLQEDKDALLNSLHKMTSKIAKAPIVKSGETIVEQMDVDEETVVGTEPDAKELTDEDDFLDQYHPLTVYKIRPNPDKEPKKKRKKNKAKKLNNK